MRNLRLFGLSSAAVLAILASCSAEKQAPAGTAWKDMNHEERLAHMKKVVMPKMKAEFIAFSAKDFSEMTCATCHGDGAKDKTFKMPNPKLPQLPSTEQGFNELKAKHPEVTKFMMEKVVPDMAGLLNEPPYNPQTHQGFGCFRCHTKKN